MPTSLLSKFSASITGATFIVISTIATAPVDAATIVSPGPTFGSDLAGMKVTATYIGGGSQTVSWDATGPKSGGASGLGWSLSVSGDTFYSSSSNPQGFWTFSNFGPSVTSLVINAIPGNAVFDIIDTLVGPPNTPGSGRGIPFTVLSGQAPNSFAYSNPIDISQGDLFGTLALNYDKGFLGTLTYVAVADKISSVPEASSVLGLLVVGTFGAGSLLKRR